MLEEIEKNSGKCFLNPLASVASRVWSDGALLIVGGVVSRTVTAISSSSESAGLPLSVTFTVNL
ncbi:MAG: hypothetical protein M3525_13535 [Acidobacteriota bacterium]|nr:hypothetical protein [Acidobacteriota bacterium]